MAGWGVPQRKSDSTGASDRGGNSFFCRLGELAGSLVGTWPEGTEMLSWGANCRGYTGPGSLGPRGGRRTDSQVPSVLLLSSSVSRASLGHLGWARSSDPRHCNRVPAPPCESQPVDSHLADIKAQDPRGEPCSLHPGPSEPGQWIDYPFFPL